MTRKSTAAMKMARIFTAGLGVFLSVGTFAAPAPDTDLADARASTAVYAYFREARDGNLLPAPRTVDPTEIRDSAPYLDALAHQYRTAQTQPGFSAAVDASLLGPLSQLDSVLDRDLQLSSNRMRQDESEVLLRNSDSLVRAKLRMNLGRDWLFLYGDVGSWDSALKWQGLVGIRVGHGANLFGGWRHVTYYLSPGRDFSSLDSEGPFVGAQRSW